MRNILSFPLALFAVILSISISACGDDDNGDNFSSADLQAQTWGLTATNTNGLNQGAAIAALFTEQEITDNGYADASELAAELNFAFALFAGATIDECTTNNAVIFNEGGALTYDYSDDCTGTFVIEVDQFSEGSTYTWSLAGNQLTLVENGILTLTFDVVILNNTTLEIRLSGNALLRTLEFNTSAETDVQLTYTYTAQ